MRMNIHFYKWCNSIRSHWYQFKWVANFRMTFVMVLNWQWNQIVKCICLLLYFLMFWIGNEETWAWEIEIDVLRETFNRKEENIDHDYSATIGCLLRQCRREVNHSTCFVLLNVQFDRYVRNHHLLLRWCVSVSFMHLTHVAHFYTCCEESKRRRTSSSWMIRCTQFNLLKCNDT